MADNLLKLVYDRERAERRHEILHDQPMAQGTLFPEIRKGMLIFVSFPGVTDHDFKTVIEHATPGLILELRPAPRFDIGKMNRQIVFQWFQSHGTRYMELTPADGTELIWDQILEKLGRVQERVDTENRPVMFLVNAGVLTPSHIKSITSTLKRADRRPWQICEVPQFRMLEVE